MKALRIVFLGTPDFAVASLRKLVASDHELVGVITAPDRLGGRGRNQVIESAVKQYAASQDITILQPTNLKSPEFIASLAALKADLQIVVAFRMLPVVVWDMPPLGTYNLHGSLLPAYRGAAPINWAVMNGEEETGVTTFKLKHEIDTGSIAYQSTVSILKTDNVGDVHDKMMEVGAGLVLKTVNHIAEDKIVLQPQDESKVSKAPKIFHEDCEIDWTKDPVTIYNHIRGLSPYPTAWMMMGDMKVKVYASTYAEHHHQMPMGKVVTDDKSYIAIACSNGLIFIHDLQAAGRKRMKTRDFLNGVSLESSMSTSVRLDVTPW